VIHARRDHWMMLMLSSVEDTMNYYSSDLDLDDAFHFDHVPPGDYMLETSGGMTKAPIQIHVDAGATTLATLELPAEPIALSVTSPDCERITLRTAAAEFLTTVECTQGVARFDDISDGDYLACTSYDACGEVTVRASPQVQEVTLQIQTRPDPSTSPSPPPNQDPEPADPPAVEGEEVTSEAP
jgi:hypothetical protein